MNEVTKEDDRSPIRYEYQNKSYYNTVDSHKSIVSIDSTLEPFPYGEIEFVDGLQRLRKSHYVRVPVNCDIEDVVKFMALKWIRKSPKIIIPVVTGFSHFKPWKNEKQLNRFKRGIIKAAYTTDLWYITSGYNIGICKLIGDAFREESMSRRTNDTNQDINQFDKLILIGIVSTSGLRNQELFKEGQGIVQYVMDNSDQTQHRFELNPDHTHFIMVDDDSFHLKLLEFRVALEKRLQKPITLRKQKRNQSSGEICNKIKQTEKPIYDEANKDLQNAIPVVCLLIGGGVGSISLVQTKLIQNIPVLVFKGTGHSPDLISGVYEDIADRFDSMPDNHLRTGITSRITEKFPKESKDDSTRNKIKDNLIEIIKFSTTKDSGNLLTFLDASSANSELHDLDKYILIALLQSQPSQSKELLQKNLMLIMDWNRPDIAISEIFQRDNSSKLEIEKFMFEKALLKKDREEFIEIFLDQGFQIHRFLNHIKMFLLFEKCEDREFFLNICLEKGMGTKLTEDDFNSMRKNPPLLFQKYINPLMKKLTDIDEFFQVLEMSLNALKLYIEHGEFISGNREFIAERKALAYLIVFAVLLKRHKLAKILWKRTDQPICVALLCSMIYKRASIYCHESYVKSELEEYSKDFAKCAVGVLDLSFSQSDSRVYDVLNRKNPDLNDLTAIELAYNSDNKDFIAHPCCQKWITKKFYGDLDIREINCGLFRIPRWTKILLSAFFIFPMYLWIVFPIRQKKKRIIKHESNASLNEESTDDADDLDEEKMIRTELMNLSTKHPTDKINSKIRLKLNLQEDLSPPFLEKILILWSAPVTKFWINLLFYIIYLSIFGLAVLWPSCGNIILDSIVWFWTALICCETARRTYNKYVMGTNLPLKFYCLEITLMLIFLILYLFIRILGIFNFDILTSKSILCCGLIYFYYRSVFVYLPISPTLGPMLVKMKYMVRSDFVTFLRMFIVFMAAGGITINAIIYPHYPLSVELIKRVFLRAFFGLFVTEKDDLSGLEECKNIDSIESANKVCSNVHERISFSPYSSAKWSRSEDTYKCPHPSMIGWAILIQYLLLVKLFLTTLLTAMFSHTKAKVDAESDQIWMFQRYEIVIDYEQRLRLPPPLTIISYALMVIECVFRVICQRKAFKFYGVKIPTLPEENPTASLLRSNKKRTSNDTNLLKRTNTTASRSTTTPNVSSTAISKKQYDHSNYWKIVVQDYAKKIDDSTREKEMYKEQVTSLSRLKEDFYIQKKNLKRLDDRILSIERNLTVVQVTVEYIKHFLTNKEACGLNSVNFGQHIMSRQSPYPFTQLARFPVYDKYISWDIVYDSYDPPIINVDKSLTFVQHDVPLTDPDDLNLIELRSTTALILSNRESICEDYASQQPQHQLESDLSQRNLSELLIQESDSISFDLYSKSINQWNRITTCVIDGQTVIVDRTTWITKNGFPLQYQIDSLGYPSNPMGRTGSRGRGALFRWGPNHEIRAIVTRWRRHHDYPKQTFKYIHVEGRRLLEFLACKDPLYGEWKLPGGKILGDISRYRIVCSCFSELVFEQASIDCHKHIESEGDMKKFFLKYACDKSTNPTDTKKSIKEQNSLNDCFTAKMIYKGYIDDPRNTDNAWIEAEIWNFHYGSQDKLNDYIPNASSKWKEVSSHVRLFANQSAILKEVATIHDAYY